MPGESITPSIHISLDHGSKIIEIFTEGIFTEEGLESTHKIMRDIKLNLLRNSPRQEKLFEIIKRLFLLHILVFNEIL